MLRILTVLSVALLTGCGMYMQIEEPRICMTRENVLFDNPVVIPGVSVPVRERTIAYDIGKALPDGLDDDRAEIEVRLTALRMKATQGDLTELARATLIYDKQDGSELYPMAEYVRDPARQGEIRDVEFEIVKDEDLGPALQKRKAPFIVMLEGDLPDEDIVADIEACFFIKGRMDYLD